MIRKIKRRGNTQNPNDVESVENKEDVNKNSDIEAQDGFDRDKNWIQRQR